MTLEPGLIEDANAPVGNSIDAAIIAVNTFFIFLIFFVMALASPFL